MKKLIAFLMTIVIVFSMAACGGGANPAADGGDTYTLKMHLSVATNEPVYKSAEKFKEIIEAETDGKVTIELYPSSSLGAAADCLEGLSMRACDIVYDPLSNLSTWTELANIEGVPYMYNDVEHFRSIWEGEVGDQIRTAIGDAANVKVMGNALMGVRVMTSNKKVESVADVKGLKLRVPTIDIYLKTWEWLGASPTPLSGSEIFTAIQQGSVDAQENPYPSCLGLSLHETVDYVVETNHVYNLCTMIMDKAFFESLPAEYQTLIENTAAEVGKIATEQIIASAEEAKQVFVDAGCEIIEVDIDEWRGAMDGFLEEKYPALVEYYNMIVDAAPAK